VTSASLSLEVVINHHSEIVLPVDPYRVLVAILSDLNVVSGYFEYSFVDPATMIQINMAHLAHDYVTDIITYDLSESDEGCMQGDVYICLEEVQKNADVFGHSFEFELKIVMTHGILHLLGYDDDTDDARAEMDRIQWDVATRLAGIR